MFLIISGVVSLYAVHKFKNYLEPDEFDIEVTESNTEEKDITQNVDIPPSPSNVHNTSTYVERTPLEITIGRVSLPLGGGDTLEDIKTITPPNSINNEMRKRVSTLQIRTYQGNTHFRKVITSQDYYEGLSESEYEFHHYTQSRSEDADLVKWYTDKRGVRIEPNEDGSLPIFSNKTLELIFDIIDDDRNGQMEREEFVRSCRFTASREKLMALLGADLFSEELFDEIDSDKRGFIDKADWVSWCRKYWVRVDDLEVRGRRTLSMTAFETLRHLFVDQTMFYHRCEALANLEDLEKLFDTMDTQEKGKITIMQFTHGAKNHPCRLLIEDTFGTEAFSIDAFHDIDDDGDGFVSKDEFLEYSNVNFTVVTIELRTDDEDYSRDQSPSKSVWDSAPSGGRSRMNSCANLEIYYDQGPVFTDDETGGDKTPPECGGDVLEFCS